MKGWTLNIGCGKDRWGDGRLDISKTYGKRQNTPNLLADAQNLPFQNEAFSEVHAYHILEHLPNCTEGLTEAARVCKRIIILKFPIDDGFKRSTLLGFLPIH